MNKAELQVGQTLWYVLNYDHLAKVKEENIRSLVIDRVAKKYAYSRWHKIDMEKMHGDQTGPCYLSEKALREELFELPELMREIRRKTQYGTIPIEKARKIVEILNQ